jgi:DNA-binding NarL/FixJ family response regulator
LLKDSSKEDLLLAIHDALIGQPRFAPSVEAFSYGRSFLSSEPRADEVNLSLLTPTEVKVLAKVGEFMTSKEIAHALVMGKRTVEKHRERIAAKLEVRGSNRLVEIEVQCREALSGGALTFQL